MNKEKYVNFHDIYIKFNYLKSYDEILNYDYKLNQFFVHLNNEKKELPYQNIIFIKKDSLIEERINSALTTEDFENAIWHINNDGSLDDEKYRLAIIEEDDLIDITINDLNEYLEKYNFIGKKISFEVL